MFMEAGASSSVDHTSGRKKDLRTPISLKEKKMGNNLDSIDGGCKMKSHNLWTNAGGNGINNSILRRMS